MLFITTLLALCQSVAISTYPIDFQEEEFGQETYLTTPSMTSADIKYQDMYSDYNAYILGTQGESHYEINRYWTYSYINDSVVSEGYSVYDYTEGSQGGNRKICDLVFHGVDSPLGSGAISLIKRSRYLSINAVLNVSVFYYNDAGDFNNDYVKFFSFDVNLWDTLSTNYFVYDTGLTASNYPYRSVTLTLHLLDFEQTKDTWVAEGYDIGYDDGYDIGKNDGFTLGQGSGQSFQNLFSVLVDTPIVFFRKLFGYELFGINLFSALTTIVSLLVALSIFRLVKGIF